MTIHSLRLSTAATALVAVVGLSGPARAQQYDTPTITWTASGYGKMEITVTAGPSGTPAGFTVWWMKLSDFQANNEQWFMYGDARQGECQFLGEPTLNIYPGSPPSFLLGPNQSFRIQVGDLFDETGIFTYSTDELDYATPYVFCAFANADGNSEQSGFSANVPGATGDASENCTYTVGYWKNHPEEWPVSSLTLGNVVYDQGELLAILHEPARGNGLVSLAHQLIATKLNDAHGADMSVIISAVIAADGLIGNLIVPPIGGGHLSPSQTSALTEQLDDYNNGIIGPGHCGQTATETSSWGSVKGLFR
jgi:hypothetical protein